MTTVLIKEKLHRFIETMDEERMKVVYALFEKEIEQDEWEYTDEFKAELDRRYDYYINGGNMISSEDADRQTNELVLKIKTK